MEYDDASYKVGMVVKHRKDEKLGWGLGEVIKVQNSTLSIVFERVGIKKLDSTKASLEIVQNKKLNTQHSKIECSNLAIGVDIDYFANPDVVYSLRDLEKCPPPSSSGVYGWYFDKLPYIPKNGWRVKKSFFDTKRYLFYVGKASNLKGRILGEHFQGIYVRGKSISSLRLTLGCLLCKELGIYLQKHSDSNKDYTFGQKGDKNLSIWMAKHARVAWVETKDYVELEERAIDAYRLPLNTDGNSNLFVPLKDLKNEFREIAKLTEPKRRDFKKVYDNFVKSAKNWHHKMR